MVPRRNNQRSVSWRFITGAIVACLGAAGCGGSHPEPASDGPRPVVGVDRHLNEPARWSSPTVVRRADGQFVARMSPDISETGGAAGRPATVMLGGIGWPRRAEGLGRPYVAPGVLSKWTNDSETYSVSLRTNARRVSLLVWNLGGRFQVQVGPATLDSPQLAGTANHHHSLDLEFPTSATRTITFKLSNGAFLSGVRVGGGNGRISPPATPSPAPPSTYWLGDSYVAGGGATHPGFDDLTHLASARAGLTDVTVDALGETGYVRTNQIAHFPDYLARARLNLGGRHARPQLIVVGGSINDAPYGEARVEQVAAALYRYLAHAVPEARVVVVPFTSAYPVPADVAASNRGILAAARAAPNVVGVLDLPSRVLSLRGATGAERRSGGLVSTVVTGHPSEAGHRLYGQIIGTFLADCVRTLRSQGASRGVCDQAR
jgi:hypothetical protein